ncbi:DUF4062 domain-containing protein [Sorangium sp. So ce1036]|uniref:DUF4062 domain-containing protein n=1 Tax=Sorangium sp. So ce1036 TaxID=3133328 RepID=UPI003F0498B6
MAKKLQIFVSSTYQDLIAERQAAVEAILTAGHIPAGMELFTAGDESQLETIYRWIDESDIFMLILGGRYGSIEKNSGKSYTQLEYEHSLSSGKATFAVVMHDDALAAKVKRDGANVLELENRDKFDAFKSTVLSKMCMFFHDHKDIQIAFHRTLARLLRERNFPGWISGTEIANIESISAEVARLSKENSDLRSRVQTAEKQAGETSRFGGLTFEQLWTTLSSTNVDMPEEVSSDLRRLDLLSLFHYYGSRLSVGVRNSIDAKPVESFLFYRVAANLVHFGLMEVENVSGARHQRIRTTKAGNDFLALLAHKFVDLNKMKVGGELQNSAIDVAAEESAKVQAEFIQNDAPGKPTPMG